MPEYPGGMPSIKALLGPARLALALMVLAAPVGAQGPSPGMTVTSPVRVADLIDRPILDESQYVVGRARAVVRTGDGKIQLLLPLGGLFGFGERLVPIPFERIALTAAGQIIVVDMPPDRFQQSATWYGSNSEPLADTDTVSISRR